MCIKVIAGQMWDVFETRCTLFHKKRDSTFVIITLENLDGF